MGGANDQVTFKMRSSSMKNCIAGRTPDIIRTGVAEVPNTNRRTNFVMSSIRGRGKRACIIGISCIAVVVELYLLGVKTPVSGLIESQTQ